MEQTLTPAEIEERYSDLPYITPYEMIIAMVDEETGLVELHEFHARGKCSGGAAWEVYHYARTSPLVLAARREGARNIFVCREGRSELELTPGIAGAGLEAVRVEGGTVELTYAGLAGGGVAATLCRGMAGGVMSTTVHERGGGASLGRATLRVPVSRKLVVGVDDTDDEKRGATWSTVNELAFELDRDGACHYLGHSIAQLFPDNPFKTTNCCSTAVVLGVRPEDSTAVADRIAETLADRCYSEHCGMAVTTRIPVAAALRAFSREARSRMVSIEEAAETAACSSAALRVVTGERGCIGALAALGMYDDPDGAVVPFGEGSREP